MNDVGTAGDCMMGSEKNRTDRYAGPPCGVVDTGQSAPPIDVTIFTAASRSFVETATQLISGSVWSRHKAPCRGDRNGSGRLALTSMPGTCTHHCTRGVRPSLKVRCFSYLDRVQVKANCKDDPCARGRSQVQTLGWIAALAMEEIRLPGALFLGIAERSRPLSAL